MDAFSTGQTQAALPVTQHKTHYLGLDGLRGVAAVAIVAFHGRQFLPAVISTQHGYLAVDFFFMLSGFVIAHAYEGRLSLGRMRFLRFVQLRAIRLYPLVMLGTTLGLLPALWGAFHDTGREGALHTLAAYPYGLLAVPVWVYGTQHYPLNGPTWSLGCEIGINLAYAIAVRRLSTWVLSGTAAISLAVLGWWAFHYGTISSIGAVIGPV